LVIGPPVSIVSAIGNAARSGVLMKGGEHLERAGKIDLVAFDKTGTLTAGETSVTNVHGFDYDDGEALRLAAIAEKQSEHHLAGAILDAARSPDDAVIADGGTYVDGPERMVDRRADGETVAERTAVPDPERFTVAAGKGVIAQYESHEIVVGNRMLLDEQDVAVHKEVEEHVHDREESGETAVYVVMDGDVVGVIALRDRVRDAAPSVVRALNDAGVRTVMLTGDNERTARTVAEHVGIDEYRAELLPEDKQRIIREL